MNADTKLCMRITLSFISLAAVMRRVSSMSNVFVAAIMKRLAQLVLGGDDDGGFGGDCDTHAPK